MFVCMYVGAIVIRLAAIEDGTLTMNKVRSAHIYILYIHTYTHHPLPLYANGDPGGDSHLQAVLAAEVSCHGRPETVDLTYRTFA